MRALAWSGTTLYASRGYELLSADLQSEAIEWKSVAKFRPVWWRKLTASSRLPLRLVRDGFHALAVLPSGHLVAAVAGAIITRAPDDSEFHVSHPVSRGTRPLHIVATPGGQVLWGEYFDNAARDEVNIFGSSDHGRSWAIAYTFPKGTIRHIHNIVYDEVADCVWVFTGDNGSECRVLRATCDFSKVELVLCGNQQVRAVAAVSGKDGLYFSTDTPLEKNFIYCLDRYDKLKQLGELPGSSIYGCRVGQGIFFSTMVEPSAVNHDRHVRIFGSLDGKSWKSLAAWEKDGWPMRFFQYGNAFLPDGNNTSGLLALSTIAVKQADLLTSLWRISGT